MPSSGYTAITFVANEQPTTAKWNLIGANDASFNTGTGFNDAILATRHFATNIVQSIHLALSNALDSTNGVKSYTNTQTNGGTGYYINLGGIKLCWGVTGYASIGTSNGVGVSLPASFFTTIQTANLYMAQSSTGDAMVRQTSAATTSLMSGWFTSGASASAALGWLVIGT